MRSTIKFGIVAWKILAVILLLELLLTAAKAGPAKSIVLKPVVQVPGDVVTLGDVAASADRGEIPREIVLCRAPDMGTARMLDAEEIAATLKKAGVYLVLNGPPQITILRMGHSISASELQPLIEAALRSAGSNAQVAGVRLQSSVIVVPGTALELTKLKFDSATRAYRAWFTARSGMRKVAFEAGVIMGRGTAPMELDLAANKRIDAVSGPAIVHRGETVMMQLRGPGFSATIPVLCLEDGRLHKLLQVRDQQGKRTYRAEVLGAGKLLEVEVIAGPGGRRDGDRDDGTL